MRLWGILGRIGKKFKVKDLKKYFQNISPFAFHFYFITSPKGFYLIQVILKLFWPVFYLFKPKYFFQPKRFLFKSKIYFKAQFYFKNQLVLLSFIFKIRTLLESNHVILTQYFSI